MSEPVTPTEQPVDTVDTVDAVVPHIPVVLPIVGALVIFMLAFIAVTMA